MGSLASQRKRVPSALDRRVAENARQLKRVESAIKAKRAELRKLAAKQQKVSRAIIAHNMRQAPIKPFKKSSAAATKYRL